ncbi:MAG: hypothetical protein ACE5FG_08835 [Myxococcota bacterium]
MSTIRSDVLVLGSSLGGLVAATYLARAGMRVVLVEEDVKRPAVMREPFLLSGLESGGRILRVLHELALPLIERRQIERTPLALQVVLPEGWVDVPQGAAALARELEAHGLARSAVAREWLAAVEARAARARSQLWESPQPARGRTRQLLRRAAPEASVRADLPWIPESLEAFVAAQLAALSTLEPPGPGPAPALLLHSLREGGFEMPDAETGFRSLFQRRLPTLHGEILRTQSLQITTERGEIGAEIDHGRLFARSLVVAAPRAPLRQALSEHGRPPDWLSPNPAPRETPRRLYRVESGSLPVGLARRVIRADGAGGNDPHWMARHRDARNPGTEWLVFSGPGASGLSPKDPLGELAPFSAATILPADPGTTPRWDRDADELRFARATSRVCLAQRPPVVGVGPELAPALGFEGEILCARRIALWLAERLGARRRMA